MVRARGTRKKRSEKEDLNKEEPLQKKTKVEENETKEIVANAQKEERKHILVHKEVTDNKENEVKEQIVVENPVSKEDHTAKVSTLTEHKSDNELAEHEKPIEPSRDLASDKNLNIMSS